MRNLLCCLLLLQVACSGDSSTTDGGSDASVSDVTASDVLGDAPALDANVDAGDPSAACNAYVAARCKKEDSCSNNLSNVLVYGPTLSLPSCESREMLQCLAALAAPGTGATPSFFTTCAPALTAQTCLDFENEILPAACVPEVGTRANGSGCSFNAQCTSTWCHVAAGASCGSCEAFPTTGATCADDGDCGARGMLCSVQNKCVNRVAIGGTCGIGLPCDNGSSCVTGGSQPNTCQQDGTTVGAACDPKRKTAPICAGLSQLFCAVNGQCATYSLPSESNGQQCGVIDLSDAGVAVDAGAPYGFGVCTNSQLCVNGGCVANASDTGACNTASGPGCLTPARCVLASDAGTAGTCQLPGSVTCN